MASKKDEEKHARAKGDKVDIRGSEKDKKHFISMVLQVFDKSGRNLLKVPIRDISESMLTVSSKGRNEVPYLKSYGNVPAIFAKEDFSGVFKYDGASVVSLESEANLKKAHTAGLLSDEDLKLCLDMHVSYLANQIKTLKIVHENRCARCGKDYKTALSDKEACVMHAQPAGSDGKHPCCKKAGGGCKPATHVPSFDFSQDPAASIDYAGTDLSCSAPAAAAAAAAGGGGAGVGGDESKKQ